MFSRFFWGVGLLFFGVPFDHFGTPEMTRSSLESGFAVHGLGHAMQTIYFHHSNKCKEGSSGTLTEPSWQPPAPLQMRMHCSFSSITPSPTSLFDNLWPLPGIWGPLASQQPPRGASTLAPLWARPSAAPEAPLVAGGVPAAHGGAAGKQSWGKPPGRRQARASKSCGNNISCWSVL